MLVVEEHENSVLGLKCAQCVALSAEKKPDQYRIQLTYIDQYTIQLTYIDQYTNQLLTDIDCIRYWA